jgi:hypothetical protein
MHDIRRLEGLGIDGLPIGKFGIGTQGKLDRLAILRNLGSDDKPCLDTVRIVDERAVWTLCGTPEEWGSVNESLEHVIGIPSRKICPESLKIALHSDPQDLLALG